MPPKTPNTAAPDKLNLTPRETELLALAWRCMETEPKLNNDQFAKLGGFGNPRSATNAWANIKKKLGLVSPMKKETTTNAIKSGDNDDNDDNDGPTTPTQKKRKAPAKAGDGSAKKPRARKGKNVKAETEDDEDAADVGAHEDGAVKQEAAEEDAMDE
ncbi:hypothetical protein MBLNU457_4578t1 [Dothideomycetes sp. NU457]